MHATHENSTGLGRPLVFLDWQQSCLRGAGMQRLENECPSRSPFNASCNSALLIAHRSGAHCQCESYHVFRLPHSCFAQVTAKPAVCRKPWSHGASKTVHKTLKNSLLWHVYTVSALAQCCFVSVQQCSMLHRQIPA